MVTWISERGDALRPPCVIRPALFRMLNFVCRNGLPHSQPAPLAHIVPPGRLRALAPDFRDEPRRFCDRVPTVCCPDGTAQRAHRRSPACPPSQTPTRCDRDQHYPLDLLRSDHQLSARCSTRCRVHRRTGRLGAVDRVRSPRHREAKPDRAPPRPSERAVPPPGHFAGAPAARRQHRR
ncbi:unnamed protein product, partial [Mycena citricolor]